MQNRVVRLVGAWGAWIVVDIYVMVKKQGFVALGATMGS